MHTSAGAPTRRAARRAPATGQAWECLLECGEGAGAVRVMHRPSAQRGPVVATVHGLEESWGSWQAVAEHLGDGVRLLALDLPWRSGNDYAWTEGPSPSRLLTDTLTRLPVRVDVLAGHSFGANTVLETLAGAAAGYPLPAVLVSPIFRANSADVTWELLHNSLRDFPKILAAGLRAARPSIPDDVVERMARALADRAGPNAFAALFRLAGHSPHIDLAAIAGNIVVVDGASETTGVSSGTDELLAGLRSARRLTLPGENHFGHVTSARQVADVLAVLAAHSPVSMG